MNILLTSVGRRAYMVKYFKDTLGQNGKVYVANSDNNSIAFHYADNHVVTPLIYDNDYIPFLLNYCKINKIDLVISLFDIDLLVLAKNKELFLKIGTRIIVSDPKIVSICNDKWKTYLFLKDNGFNVPKTFITIEDTFNAIDNEEIYFPIIVKPRFGCGSISVSIAYDREELCFLSKKANKVIESTYLKYESANEKNVVLFQECLCGQEFGADLINDLKGDNQSVIVRKKIAMRSGETDIAELVHEPLIYQEGKRLAVLTKHIANMDTDWFIVDGNPYILEMNARFGGGYPFSHMGGCNLPLAIIKWSMGEIVSHSILTAEVGIKGYKEIYITKV